MPQRLIVLLPVRNAAADLPGFFAAARRLGDAIVALDDGSTDETRRLLEREPLVAEVLSNPVRPSWEGWHDARNRNRLLAAAGSWRPDWILSLDADERIDHGDAAALRQFLESDALPGCAYGFQHIPMRESDALHLPESQWVYRLFAWEPGQRFPDQRLHFVPVPTDLPRALWVRTSLRIQHLGGMTDARRLERFAKYVEADPDRYFRADYDQLLAGPRRDDLRPWETRPADRPVILVEEPGPVAEVLAEDLTDEPEGDQATEAVGSASEVPLSVVVISYNDERTIEATVRSVATQTLSDPFEVIVVTSGTDRTATIVREKFPGVRLIALPRRALPGEARNAGLRVATGTYISFPGSHVELPPGSLQARVDAHRRGYAMVTGVATNGTTTPAGWASYFVDHHAGLPGHRPARIDGPPAHCSYSRRALIEAGGFPEGVRSAEDTSVNQVLVSQGHVAFREPAIRFTHRSPCRTFPKLITHHFTRGRGWGRLVVGRSPGGRPVIDRTLLGQRLLGHIPGWMRRIDQGVARADVDLLAHYRSVRSLVLAAVIAGWAGMWFEILRSHPTLDRTVLGVRDFTLMVVPEDASAEARLIRLDLRTRYVQALSLRPKGAGGRVTGQPDAGQLTRTDRIADMEGRLGVTATVVLRRLPVAMSYGSGSKPVRLWPLIPAVVLGSGPRTVPAILRRLIVLLSLVRRFAIVETSALMPTPLVRDQLRPARTRVPGQMSQ